MFTSSLSQCSKERTSLDKNGEQEKKLHLDGNKSMTYYFLFPFPVSVSSNKPFIGVILQARKVDTSWSYGTFSLPSGDTSLRNCDRDKDSVFLWLDEPTTNMTATWTPPTNDVGSLRFM